ncbi:MAG: chemotaxis protein CheW [Fibrobacteres bacterium]|nr:chemotaxis protein CheW [Fibrobacterota bacterium]
MAERQFTTFKLGNDLFGIDILLVREINRSLQITPVEGAPEFVTGLLNLRGQIVTVIDLGVRLGLNKREIADTTRCIILKTAQELSNKGVDEKIVKSASADQVGFLVDYVGDMVAAAENEIAPPPANLGQVSEKFLTGVVKLEQGLVGLLDVGRILQVQA